MKALMEFHPSTVYITTPKPANYYPNSIEINETSKKQRFCKNTTYILNFKDSSLHIFKRMFPLGLKIIVYVYNFEYFFYKFRVFKHLNFIFIDDIVTEKIDNKIEEYLRVESEIREKLKKTKSTRNSKRLRMLEGGNTARSIVFREQEKTRSVDISFFPKIFDSIRSSLLDPRRYLHEEFDVSSQIYKELLKGKRSIAELKEIIGNKIERELKSLIFASVVKSKDGYFYI